ncbi:MAG: hypothetical protein RsTaC01_0477 [Candidatus Paraimprobicoccus trichonymphae]|uniref:Calpain catalytic domain-containing protein n=1 Tax=Candidatus Paraimprobicoccus trichonymphae TaxID=3033793 RepID=A0AA48I9M1_9FIRM|nr:MAG: hypothetical protein RsTaC01_0477 [Candidatus Paraimprobicoccus trichonymphae]
MYRPKGFDVSMGTRKLEELKAAKTINSRIIDGINGGNAASVMVTVTDISSNVFGWNNSKKTKKFPESYTKENLKIFNIIKNALNSGKIIMASASKYTEGKIPNLYSKGLFLNHTYTITGFDEVGNTKYVTVEKPYRGRIREYDENHKSKAVIPEDDLKKGISKLELNDFCNYFRDIQFF